MSSDQFRKNLEQFYKKINNSKYLDVYKTILSQQLDDVQVQPIHIISLSQQPSSKNLRLNRQQQRKRQVLYKSTDFASVFLFAFLLDVLQKRQIKFIEDLEERIKNNLDNFYKERQAQDSIKYRFMFRELFQFFYFLISKQYQTSQIQKLFKSFFNNTFQRRGLKKVEREKYVTETQVILSLILSLNNFIPSKKQINQPTSDAYQLNSLQFCINIQNVDQRQEWTIGEGQNHINISKQKGEYLIYQHEIVNRDEIQDILDENWLSILKQSQTIKKAQEQKTGRLFDSLNIQQCRSPSKSVNSKVITRLKTFF